MPNNEPWSAERTAQIIGEHQGVEGPLLPILHALQEEFGYIDEAAVPLLADALNISHAEVHGVIGFYHDFRRQPVGRHQIRICRAEACQSMGCDRLIGHLESKLGVQLGEMFYLTPLAQWLREHRRYRFLLTAPPLRMPGVVGSPVTPVATV